MANKKKTKVYKVVDGQLLKRVQNENIDGMLRGEEGIGYDYST